MKRICITCQKPGNWHNPECNLCRAKSAQIQAFKSPFKQISGHNFNYARKVK